MALWQIKQYLSTLSCPVEDRETERVPVSPFVTFGNAGESDPFTCGGRGGGGDCVMNCEDSALVNDGRLLYYVFNHQGQLIFKEFYCVENSRRFHFISFLPVKETCPHSDWACQRARAEGQHSKESHDWLAGLVTEHHCCLHPEMSSHLPPPLENLWP